ncbi:methyltransferase [Actinomadura yumaensis]|uniref:Methyltransferase n=2 Tax=Actinomadura TaxID=1988 RepID=A0ABW2CQ60_9ACTN
MTGHDTGLWGMADVMTPMAIRVAATLGVADRIAAGTRTAPELAKETGAHAEALDRVMRHLAAVGVLVRDASGRYEVSEKGGPLRSDHPGSIRPFLDIDGAMGRGDVAFANLLHSVRTGEAAFTAQFGVSFWDDLAADPERRASFNTQMGYDAMGRAHAVSQAFDWGSLGRLVDVGGGNGTVLAALLKAHEGLKGTVLDLPDTVAEARETIAAQGLADRCDVVAGSFFDPLPEGADGYLLSAVLHDWDDEASRSILRRCAEAAGGGRVFVAERIGPDGELHTETDLRMLAYLGGGRERGVAELAGLAADAGLRVAAVHPAPPLSVVELAAA